MRLIRLDLEAYGPFTGRSLAFSPEARVHVVHGPNEAGKSSALAAVADLLFRFDHVETRDFMHPMQNLRVGAELIARDGTRLVFRRRRGTGSTLRDADDGPLPETLLDPFLAGIDKAEFRRSFGLTQDGLRDGAAALIDPKRDARGVFAAAAGLGALSGLEAAFGEEADGLWKPRAQKTVLAEARRRHDEADTALKRNMLTRDRVETAERVLAEAGERRDALLGERARLRLQTALLERVLRAGPIIARLGAIEAERAALADLPADAGALADAISSALAEEERTGRAAADAARTRAALESDAAADPGHAALLGHRLAIDALARAAGAADAARKDLPKRRDERARLDDRLERAVRALGLADVDALIALRPSDAERAQAASLLARKADLEGRLAEARALRAERDRDLSRAEALRDATPPAPDPAPLRRRAAALQPLRAAEQARSLRLAEIQGAHARIADRLAALSPQAPDLDALPRCRLPDRTALDALRRTADALERDRIGHDERLAAARRRVLDAERKLAETPRPAATGADLDAVRRLRDGLVARVTEALAAPERFEQEAREALARDLGLAIAQADRTADRLRADADAVAAADIAAAALDAARADLAAIEGAAAQALDAASQALAEQVLATTAAMPEPQTSVDRALGWLDAVERARADLSALADTRMEAERLGQRIAASRGDVAELAAAVGLTPLADTALALEEIDRALDDVARRFEARQAAVRGVSDAQRRLEDARTAETALGAEIDAVEQRWRDIAPRLGAAPEQPTAAASALLAAWNDVPAAIDERADLDHRIAGMDAALAGFTADAHALTVACAGVPGERSPFDLADGLITRLRTAEAIAARIAQADSAVRAAERAHADARAAVDAIATRCGVAPADLATHARRLGDRARLDRDLAEASAALAAAAPGHDRASSSPTPAVDGGALEAELAALRERLDGLDVDIERAIEARERAQADWDGVRASFGAERDAQAKALASADIAVAARRWAVLEAARRLTGAALERHRARYQHPLLDRASALLRRMTGDGLAGLRVEADARGEPMLVARRADGASLVPGGLSEGTRDQMFLALRLAAVEAYAAERDPPPFLADDILMTFDDVRAGHALEALAETGGRVQVILFTHHRHVVDLARARLGAAADIVSL